MEDISKNLFLHGESQRCCSCFKLWRKPKFAAPYQMRWSLETKFHARHFRIKTIKNKGIWCYRNPVIDAYLLPWIFSNDSEREDEAIEKCPTIIVCFPNGGYIEYFYFQWEWVNFYLEQGINVFLWNYRGFYNSTGYPTSQNIVNDAELVYDYLKYKIGAKGPIGAHGESLGGFAATHLGKYKNLKFLLIDRSFWWVDKIVTLKYGYWLYKGFKWISGFNIKSDENFLDTNWFKIVAQDSNDTVINNLGNLKNGITLKMIQRSHELNHISIDDAHTFLGLYQFFEETREELHVLFKYYRKREREEEDKTNKQISKPTFNKISSEPMQPGNVNKSSDKSSSNFTKASSRGSYFKSLTGSAARQKNKFKGWEESKNRLAHDDNWNVSILLSLTLILGGKWACFINKAWFEWY